MYRFFVLFIYYYLSIYFLHTHNTGSLYLILNHMYSLHTVDAAF